MRISEEVDALEVMGVKSIAFLASTRIIAAIVCILPLYGLAMVMAFLSPQLVTTLFYGQSSGTYDHYFRTFLRPEDVAWSFAMAVVIAIVVMVTHCFYGYTAAGGRWASGKRLASRCGFLVAVVVVAMLGSLALYGVDPNFNLSV